jgi:hypothetical protein
MTGQQTVVAAGGVGLILANMWVGNNSQRAEISGIFSGNGPSAHSTLVTLAGEMLFVLIATILAGLSSSWGNAIAVAIVALFVIWSINHFGSSSTAKTTGTAGGSTGGMTLA